MQTTVLRHCAAKGGREMEQQEVGGAGKRKSAFVFAGGDGEVSPSGGRDGRLRGQY